MRAVARWCYRQAVRAERLGQRGLAAEARKLGRLAARQAYKLEIHP